MAPVLTIVLFALAIGSLIVAGSGIRMLQADMRLRNRLAEDAPRAGRGTLHVGLPRLFVARGRDRAEIEQKLRAAGYFEPNAIERFVWFRLTATSACAFIAFLLMSLRSSTIFSTAPVTFITGGLAYIGAKYVLQMQATKREHRLTSEFPFLLDLMLMMLESGISLDQCFRSIARDERATIPHHGPLVAMLVEDLDRGQDYQTAMDRWADRVAVFGAKELATLFRQSLFHGMELAPALREFIVEFSQRRIARARETIGKITVRMVVLMLVFFMPALFVVLAGPPVVAIFDTLRGVTQ